MLHVGLDLSRRRVDVCLISSEGELVEHFRVPADRDGLYGLTRRVAVYDESVRGVVESMNGARFVHDELVRYGWEVLVADAQRVKGLAPLACKTDKVDARVLAELSFRDLVPAIWLPSPELRAERERSRWRLHLVKHRSILKGQRGGDREKHRSRPAAHIPGRPRQRTAETRARIGRGDAADPRRYPGHVLDGAAAPRPRPLRGDDQGSERNDRTSAHKPSLGRDDQARPVKTATTWSDWAPRRRFRTGCFSAR